MLFSIVIPTYNRADLLPRAIQSVLGQTLGDWELIVIDDASTDETPAVLAGFCDPRLRVFRNQPNRERSASRNRGIEAARGDYICFLDSDDLYLPHHLETLAQAIASAQVKEAMFFTHFLRKHPDRDEPVDYPPVGGNRVEYVIRHQVATPTTCFHRSLLANERFDTRLKINEDVELFARVVAKAPLVRLTEVTVHTFFHPTNTMATVADAISPQIVAMKKIFAHPVTGRCLAPEFKREIMIGLRHQLIPVAWKRGRWAAFQALISFLVHYPLDPLNRAKCILLLGTTPLARLIPSIGRASATIIDRYY
jgi:glycosyltransferase involved in cell wall biosynthesis